jgi:predicted P-loop ATPase
VALDFKAVAAAALSVAPSLLTSWIGGRAHGREWKGERKANGGLGDSWCVNLDTGAWAHFGGDAKGGDLISLYAALHHVDQVPALEAVAELIHMRPDSPPPINLAKAPKEAPAEEIPPDAPPAPRHHVHGAADAVYQYGYSFAVARYDLPEGKRFCQLTWRQGRWQWKGRAAPRQLYGAEIVIKNPEAPVLVVEGEKCAEAARAVLKRYAVVTWAGGASVVLQNDWAPLNGRDVLLWPDADAPGCQAMAQLATRLAGHARRVRVIQPDGQPEGWDIADAIADGWTASQIAEWAGAHLKEPVPERSIQELTPSAAIDVAARDSETPAMGESPAIVTPGPASLSTLQTGTLADRDSSSSAVADWHSLNLDCGENGQPHATLANCSAILQYHNEFKGKIWLDTFREKIFTTIRGPTPVEWKDTDTRMATAYIQHKMRMSKFTSSMVNEAVMHAAECNPHNSLLEWLDSLVWDGKERLDIWLCDCLGVEKSPYTIAVGNNWPISMVARALIPGCQVDTMVVLEGQMGKGKSSFLAALGGEWFEAVPQAIGEKDWLQAIQGVWLAEIPDMTGFSRREHSQILASITIRSDRFRSAYGRFVEDRPRKCVFAATSEQDDYLQETRGRRRFWPLRCTAIDLDALHTCRDQVFAEALLRYRKGIHWYDMPPETDAEQLDRASQDLWHDRVVEYCEAIYEDDERFGRRTLITSTNILKDAIDLPLAKQTDGEKRRIAKILTGAGWIQRRDAHGRFWKRVIR